MHQRITTTAEQPIISAAVLVSACLSFCVSVCWAPRSRRSIMVVIISHAMKVC